MNPKKFYPLMLLIFLSCGTSVHKVPPQTDITPVATIPLPWSADFEQPTLDGWQIVPDTPTEESTWKVERGLLVQGSDVFQPEAQFQKYLGTHIVAGDGNWNDYGFFAVLRNLDDDGIGLLFRYQDAKNYYRLFMLNDPEFGGPFLQVDKCVKGHFQLISKLENFSYPPSDSTFSVGIKVKNDSIRVFIGDKILFQLQDSTFFKGKIGFSCFANQRLCVDLVEVGNAEKLVERIRRPVKPINAPLNHAAGAFPFAIRGIVFQDKNEDGRQDLDEPGLPQIAVSDGRDVVFTNQYGVYSLPNESKDAQFVFVSVPAHYSKKTKFFHLLNDTLGQRTFNFPLVRANSPDRLPANFIQITDIHISDEKSGKHFSELLDRLKTVKSRPEFIVATGDLVEKGSICVQMKTYSSVAETFPISIFSIFGNHDQDNGLNALHNFHQFLGPDYFSFDYANWHFISYNNIFPSKKQKQWFENDLAQCTFQKNVVIFQHFPPDLQQLTFLAKYNVKAIFSGHWHSSKIFRHNKIVSYNTPPFRFGGIDNSPAGFRLVTFSEDTIHSKYLFNTLEKRIQVVSPAQNSIYIRKYLNLIVNLYDFPVDVVRVRFQLLAGDSFNEIGELHSKTDWTWMKQLSEPLPEGAFRLKLSVLTADNQEIKIESPFTVKYKTPTTIRPDKPCPMFKQNSARTGFSPDTFMPPLTLNWVGCTGGSIDFAAPVLAGNLVAIAGKDRNNLSNNYIYAFQVQTGILKWCFETRAAINHSLVSTDDQIMGQDILGNIYALDTESGELLWQQSLSEDSTEFWLYAAPLLDGDRLFTGNTAGFAALDATNGTILWKKRLGPHWISSYASPSLVHEQILLGAMWHSPGLYALDAVTGERLWEYPAPGLHGAVAIEDDWGYFGTSHGEVVSVKIKTGAEKWRTRLGDGWIVATPSICDSLIIVGSGDGKMVGLHRHSGEMIWSFQCQDSIVPISPYRTSRQALTGSPTIVGTIAYFGATDGFLYALDAFTGKFLWKYQLGVPVLSTPVISGNALFIAAFDGNVYCFVR